MTLASEPASTAPACRATIACWNATTPPMAAYWRSYDFSDNTDRQNIFQRPLGPVAGAAGFVPAGGEIIFNLPNGLQAYMLVDSNGRRIDKAPGDIVSDPKRPDKLVENGLSCMGCHAKGLLPKDDQVRAHVQKNRAAFLATDRDAILALYAPPARLRNLLKSDVERYSGALQASGRALVEPEQIETAVLRFEAVLDVHRRRRRAGFDPGGLRRSPPPRPDAPGQARRPAGPRHGAAAIVPGSLSRAGESLRSGESASQRSDRCHRHDPLRQPSRARCRRWPSLRTEPPSSSPRAASCGSGMPWDRRKSAPSRDTATRSCAWPAPPTIA